MSAELPRDRDGYVDLEAFPDDEVELDLTSWVQTPSLGDDLWDLIVTTATSASPADLGIDVDALTGRLSDLEEGEAGPESANVTDSDGDESAISDAESGWHAPWPDDVAADDAPGIGDADLDPGTWDNP